MANWGETYKGKLCPKGHTTRYVQTDDCAECKKQKRVETRERINEYQGRYYKKNKETLLEISKQSYQNNKEHIAEVSHRYYQNNKERCNERSKQWRIENKERIKERNKQLRLANPMQARLRSAKKRASKQGVPFNLTLADFPPLPEVCPMGIPFTPNASFGSPGSPTLDRVIPRLGYTKGNVQWLSARANRIKDNATLDELKAIIAYLEKHTPDWLK